MTIKHKNRTIMVNHGSFEVGTYGRYTYRGEILHVCDSYVYGNNEKEVLEEVKSFIDEDSKGVLNANR